MSEHGDMNFQVTALNDLRAQFVQALEADVVTAAPARVARRTRFEWRRAFAVPAIALAIAVVAIAISTIPWSGTPTVAEATADVAKTALAANYPPDDWFTYSRSRQTQQHLSVRDHKPLLERTERRAWLSVARRGTIEIRPLRTPAEAPTVFAYPAYGRYRIGDRTYTRREIDALAANPQALVRQIDVEAASVGRGEGDSTKWMIITEALRDLSPPLPATLRATLIAELGTIRGVTVLDADRDPLGRRAVGLAFLDEDTRSTVWFDRSTSALSYSNVVVAELDGHRGPDVQIGDTIEQFELLESKATPTAPQP
ncbi:MAG: hypothetical protein JHC98_03105 [Thermoleophilaceae bacterium]|nr:hypothetical protein [Thermoleophilaceae bacterium]